MYKIIERNGKYYLIEAGYGFNMDRSTVTEYNEVDKFNRLRNGRCVFQGKWDDCIAFVDKVN